MAQTEHQVRQRHIAWALRLHLGSVNLQSSRAAVFSSLPAELLNSLPARRLETLAAQAEAINASMLLMLRELSELSAAYTAAHPTEGTWRSSGKHNRRRGDKK